MPKIIIGNGFSDAMVGDVSKNSLAVRRTAAVEARRLTWFVENEDLIILPSPVSNELISYVNNIMRTQLSQKNFIYTSQDPLEPKIITSEVLLSERMLSQLKTATQHTNNWQLFPYFYTSSIQTLADVLQNEAHHCPTFLTQSGADLLNQKAAFRAIYAHDVPIAKGAVCRNVHELYQQAKLLLSQTAKLIIKQNMNASGDGNILVSIDKNGPFAGIRDIIFIDTSKDFTLNMAKQLWDMLSDAHGNHQLVIEEYVTNQNTLYAEYNIKSDSSFEMLSYGIVRMEGSGDKRGNGIANWVGFEIPYKANVAPSFLNHCNQLARTTGQLGFVGRINFDAIVCEDNQILFTEVNGRLGGCSHLAHVCQKILGKRFLDETTLITRNRVPIADFKQVILLAEKLKQLFRHSGIIILNEDMACLRLMEYLVYAPTKAEACALEQQFLHQLTLIQERCKEII
ncbi:hypothetical protein [Legionella beliardensis]|nr:hypothetical protein [Legionella beliardensis]